MESNKQIKPIYKGAYVYALYTSPLSVKMLQSNLCHVLFNLCYLNRQLESLWHGSYSQAWHQHVMLTLDLAHQCIKKLMKIYD
jgi:hypothetical protein